MKNSKCTQYIVKLHNDMLHASLFPLHRLCENYLEHENFFLPDQENSMNESKVMPGSKRLCQKPDSP